MMRFAPLLLVLGCTYLPTAPEGAYEVEPPPEYREWFDITAACLGFTRSFEVLRWYVVPGEAHFRYDDGDADGVWRGVSIYLAEYRLMDELLVRHEVLHYLLQDGDHPIPPFGVCDRSH